jgi:hypothetical protein
VKLTPSEEFDLRNLLVSYRQTPSDTMAGERRTQDIVRWVNRTIEGRQSGWQDELDEALESL